MRILVIESEPRTARVLQKGLEANHYAVDMAPDGEEGLQLAGEIDYDALIVDSALPRLDGLTVIRRLRNSGLRSLILMISSETDSTAVVRGLKAGADSYMDKPFALQELLARMDALLRRPRERLDVLRVDDLELDRMRHSATRAGKVIRLTPREYAILEFLMRNAGRVVTRSMLVEHVWNVGYDGLTNVVDVHINSLRSKLAQGSGKRLIHTARGAGYVLGLLTYEETDLELTAKTECEKPKDANRGDANREDTSREDAIGKTR